MSVVSLVPVYMGNHSDSTYSVSNQHESVIETHELPPSTAHVFIYCQIIDLCIL